MTNQNWNDPANPQGQQPTYGQQPYGQPSAPDATPGYQAPGQTPGYSAPGQSPDAAYGQTYGATPSYGSADPSQASAGSYGSPAPSYGQSSYGTTDPSQAAAGSYGSAAPSYGQSPYGTTDPTQGSTSSYGSSTGSYGSTGTDPAAGSYGSASGAYGAAGSYGSADASYGQQAQSYGTPVGSQGGSYGSPVQPGYADTSGQQAGAYDPYGAQQAGAVSPYGYDSGYATPAPALADFGKRAIAGLIDYVAPGMVVGILGGILGGLGAAIDSSGTVSGLFSLLTYVALLGFLIWNTVLKGGNTGVTIGRQVAKIKLVSEATGQPIGAMNAFIRHLVHFVDSLICYVGWLFPLWDAKRQTLADKIMKTVVVNNDGTPTQGQQF